MRNRDIGSPGFLVPIFFFLYASVYPVYIISGGDDAGVYQYESLQFSLVVSLLFIVSYVSGLRIVKDLKVVEGIRYIGYPNTVIKFWYIFFIVMFIPGLLFQSGTNKFDRNFSNATLYISMFGGIYMPYALMVIKNIREKGRIPNVLSVLFLCVGLLGSILLDERDQLILPLGVMIVIFSRKYKYNIVQAILLVGTGIVVFFIMGVMRQYEYGGFRELSSLTGVLQQNEFISAGRNLVAIIKLNKLDQFTLIGDIVAGFGIKAETGSAWFADHFYRRKGFGLVAELYLNGGLSFVVFMSFLFGVSLKKLYVASYKNDVFFAIYSVMLFSFIFALRQDLSTISSGLIRKSLFPLFLIYISSILVSRDVFVKKK